MAIEGNPIFLNSIWRWPVAAADVETSEERPKCGYDVNPSDQPYKPCGSERGLNRVLREEGAIFRTGTDIVCDEHKSKVWSNDHVDRIEPLDRTTK